MAHHEVDAYLASLDEPVRTTLDQLRTMILEEVPEAEQVLSYGVPAFKVRGKAVAGFAAYKNHLSYLPHSGTALAALGSDLDGWETTKGALKFSAGTPLPKPLVSKLIAARLREVGSG
ncbi:MAG: DUF1801 domain-containing protein [Acidimicrobiia bacterium]|nr:DUF1801 domain-containing protein [Acidimicrobiia bacterium]